MPTINNDSHNAQCISRVCGLIFDESRWTKNAHARKSDGKITYWWDYTATQFSLYGAIRRCCNINEEFYMIAYSVQEVISTNNPGMNIISFNDYEHTSYDNIMEVLSISSESLYAKGNKARGITVTKTMRKSLEKDIDLLSGLDRDAVYYLGYNRGVTQRIEWE